MPEATSVVFVVDDAVSVRDSLELLTSRAGTLTAAPTLSGVEPTPYLGIDTIV
jgi:FixJ family two-component response regulator